MLSTLLSTLPFAALAAADLTTSIWGPSAILSDWQSSYRTPPGGYYASVVNVDNDRTTLVVRNSYATNPSKTLPDPKDPVTMTVGPSYYNVINSVIGRDINLTASFECTSSSQDAAIVCTDLFSGPEVFSSTCSRGPYTSDAPMVTDSSMISAYPLFCSTDTTARIEYLNTTLTLGDGILTTSLYKFVITAGEEKLSATTGATPTNTGPPTTGGATAGSGTGGAGPIRTSAPLLAGLGAAMAVFVL